MLKTELLVETLGEPDIGLLDEVEQGIFLETLFDRIVKLNNEKK